MATYEEQREEGKKKIIAGVKRVARPFVDRFKTEKAKANGAPKTGTMDDYLKERGVKGPVVKEAPRGATTRESTGTPYSPPGARPYSPPGAQKREPSASSAAPSVGSAMKAVTQDGATPRRSEAKPAAPKPAAPSAKPAAPSAKPKAKPKPKASSGFSAETKAWAAKERAKLQESKKQMAARNNTSALSKAASKPTNRGYESYRKLMGG